MACFLYPALFALVFRRRAEGRAAWAAAYYLWTLFTESSVQQTVGARFSQVVLVTGAFWRGWATWAAAIGRRASRSTCIARLVLPASPIFRRLSAPRGSPRRLAASIEYIIIADVAELTRQPDLEAFIAGRGVLEASGERWRVFRLHVPALPAS